MNTFQAHTPISRCRKMSRLQAWGWYGMAFFLLKGLAWLLAPLLMYAIR